MSARLLSGSMSIMRCNRVVCRLQCALPATLSVPAWLQQVLTRLWCIPRAHKITISDTQAASVLLRVPLCPSSGLYNETPRINAFLLSLGPRTPAAGAMAKQGNGENTLSFILYCP